MKIRFDVEYKDGAIYCTSPDVRGLLVSGKRLDAVMQDAVNGMHDLLLAAAIEKYRGNPVQPVFTPVVK